MYFSPSWQNQLLYKLLPSRQLLHELFPLRNLAKMLSRTGVSSLDDILYRDLAPQAPEPPPFLVETFPAADYPLMPDLYQQPDLLSEPIGSVEAQMSDERAFTTPPLPTPVSEVAPVEEIEAAINEARELLPDPLEPPGPPADELFPPIFDVPF